MQILIIDILYGLTTSSTWNDDLYEPPIPIVDISWSEQDALPFSLCITSNKNNNKIITNDGSIQREDTLKFNYIDKGSFIYCSVAHANIVLADHGCTVFEILGKTPTQGKFYPKLSLNPITNTNIESTFNDNVKYLSANNSINYNLQSTIPVIYLIEITSIKNSQNIDKTENASSSDSILKNNNNNNNNYFFSFEKFKKAIDDGISGIKIRTQKWEINKDSFNLNEFDNGFVTEIESDGTVNIRFGDGYYGQAPLNSTDQESHVFCAVYRVGNGIKGNVNAEAYLQNPVK